MSVDDLPDAEVEVLAALWEHGETTARRVRESMERFRPMTHGAVFTLLSRLEAKGLVTRRKGDRGKAFLYRAKIRPQRTYRRLAGDLLERVFRGRSVTLVNSLFETAPPSDAEIDELQRMLEEMRRERGDDEVDR